MNIDIDLNYLTDEELKVLYIFTILMNRVNQSHNYKITNQNKGEGILGIYKDENGWKTFIIERGQKCGIETFDSLDKACIDIFNRLELNATNYCLEMFPKLLNEDFDMNYIYEYFRIKRNKTKKI